MVNFFLVIMVLPFLLVFLLVFFLTKNINKFNRHLVVNKRRTYSKKMNSPEPIHNTNRFTSDCRSYYGSNKTHAGSFNFMTRHNNR